MSGLETALTFTIRQSTGESRKTISIRHTVIAGWTGRDQTALEKHIRDLAPVAATVVRPTGLQWS